MPEFKGVEEDPARRMEYEERLRLSLVTEEYYKLLYSYPDEDRGALLVRASENIRDRGR